MTDSGLVLKGDRDVLEAFRDLREYLPKTALRRAVRVAARSLQVAVRNAAPEGTGKLKANIDVRTRATKATVRGRVTINTVGKGDNPKNAWYWRFVEFGHRIGTKTTGVLRRKGKFRGGESVGTVPAAHFIRQAVESHQAEAAQIVVDEVEKAIQRAERKARRAG